LCEKNGSIFWMNWKNPSDLRISWKMLEIGQYFGTGCVLDVQVYGLNLSEISLRIPKFRRIRFSGVFSNPLGGSDRTIGEQSTPLRPALRGYWLTWIYSSEPDVVLFFRSRNWEEKSLSETFVALDRSEIKLLDTKSVSPADHFGETDQMEVPFMSCRDNRTKARKSPVEFMGGSYSRHALKLLHNGPKRRCISKE
jgi:hypothetical protein